MGKRRRRGTNPAEFFAQKALSRKWPPEATLRQMLAESTDLQLGELLGYHRNEVSAMRAMLGVPPFSRGGSSTEKAKRRQQFIAKWRPRISEAGQLLVGSEGVQQSGEGDAGMSAITAPERKPAPPMTPGQLLVEIRRYHKTHHRWPTVAEMAVELDRHETTIREHSYRLVSQNLIERDNGQLVPNDLAASEEGQVKTEKWTPQQIEDHLHSLGVAPKSPPAKQVPDESEEDAGMKDAVGRLPSAEVLQAEAEEYRHRGERFTKALANKYAVDPKDITNALYRARTGHPHGLPRGKPPASAKHGVAHSTITSEAPEAEQEATEAAEQGAGSAEPESDIHALDLLLLLETRPLEVEHQMQAAAAVQAENQVIRHVALRLVPLLAAEIHDDATLGRVVRRLMREGVAS